MNLHLSALLLLSAAAGTLAVPKDAPCNSNFSDLPAGSEFTFANSTADEEGQCVRTFGYAAGNDAVLECFRVSNGRSIFVSTTGHYGGQSELHGNDFEGKITGNLAVRAANNITVTVSAPLVLPALEGVSHGSLGGVFQHTQYNCSVRIVSAEVTASLKPEAPSCDDATKVYALKSGEAFKLSADVLAKCPVNFAIPNEVRPTISCVDFNLGQNVVLGLTSTGVVPKQGLTFQLEQLREAIFGYLPIHPDAPARNWTLELENREGGDKTKAVVDCILGADIFVVKA
jgi:hypothetical protein